MSERERDLHLLHSVQTGAEDQPAAYSRRFRFFPWERSDQRVKLTTRFHLAQRLRMHGLKPPLPHTPRWRGDSLYAPRQVSTTLLLLALQRDFSLAISGTPSPIPSSARTLQVSITFPCGCTLLFVYSGLFLFRLTRSTKFPAF